MSVGSTSLPPLLPSGADLLVCIASYWPSATQGNGSGAVRRQQRLPLAWIAASPAARVVAEQRHAWVVLPFTQIGTCPADAEVDGAASDGVENTFGSVLANATVQPRVLQVALKTDSADASATGLVSSSSKQTAHGSVVASVLSWLRRTGESLADVGHAVSPVRPASLSFNGPASPPSTPLKTAKGRSISAARGVKNAADAAGCCGAHIGGITVVLVSGVHELDAAGAGAAFTEGRASSDGAAKQKGAFPTHGEGKPAALSPRLLFPSTTSCGGSVASMLSVPPNAAVYNGMAGGSREERMPSTTNSIFRAGAELHGDDGGADDETANDPKTATSVYVVQQFSELRHRIREAQRQRASAAAVSSRGLLTTVWYRQVFVGTAEATDKALCGVSQWWLQRSIRRHELPTTASQAISLTHGSHSVRVSGSSYNEPRTLPPPLLHIKYVDDVFADLWWPRRFIMIVYHRLSERTAHAPWAAKLFLLMWMILVVFVESVLHGVLQVAPPLRASDERHSGSGNGTSHQCRVPPVDLISAFHKMGRVYGRHQLAALDVSHTGVRGTHLLACVLGSVMTPPTTSEGEAAVAHGKGLWALDVAGCTQLRHRRGELYALSHMLDQLCSHAASRVAELSLREPSGTLAVADLLLSLSLRDGSRFASPSATGLALALLTHHGHLTWVCAAGSDVDSAALRELGRYALLVEAAAATQQPQPPHSPMCTLRALDLTSALRVDDVNPMGYLTQLEQLLLPFTYVDDVGIGSLDGHTYAHDLSAMLALFTTAIAKEAPELPDDAQKSLQSTLDALQHLILIDDDGAGQADVHRGNPRKDLVEALHQKFRSHLYHLDLTYCLCVSSVKGLVRQQQLELLNLSQTRVNKFGLFGGTDPHDSSGSSASAAQPRRTPPLRLFIAEMCEHLSDLSGLAHISTLECVIVRSGSLGDDGLRALCTPDMQRLQLMDLSYCDRLHHVGCLAQLPALETLILDSTDVTPAEVKQLRSSRSLHTLSLRFCTEFAFIGRDLEKLEAVVGTFAALNRYLYEDLAGDDELRKKTN
ncbi:hypothetical protein conserved [Leishmania donovani]|uniref:Uncharacterized protein n=4 Tax=Leishmania donovani species complex TaxID=38574 RepID=A4I9N4_LEIIN|nr:hypothetical protein, unknown function [Leishmania infantum JPCM5]TPP50464.1 hypothetical protein CGC20_2190 [Leishmania donovani]CAJ1992409.1 hypothetical protein conserved [Leishmania donovani]CAM71537.2 hypothetical protein, unknown function [Leishmania infantum JPCM5]|eukprot:XP_001468453.2 hypothetical protein, unknown function [Leishmania infantum JPCM5]